MINSKKMVSDFWSIGKQHITSILIFLLSIHIIGGLAGVVVYNSHLQFINDNIKQNISEYEEIDYEQLCKLANCSYVILQQPKNSKIFTIDEDTNHIKPTIPNFDFNFTTFYDVILIDYKNQMFGFYNNTSEAIYVVGVDNLMGDFTMLFSSIIPILLIVFIIPLFFSIKNEQTVLMIAHAGNEAMMTNKSMIMITENIHHELNTPLEVIDNKLTKIQRTILKFIKLYDEDSTSESTIKQINRIKKLKEDFQFMTISSEQIYSVLEKMKGFKHLRYSNGNKTIKDIIDGAFKVISIANTNFSYNIDETLSLYRLKNENTKNGDLLSVFINHIKNSLEADASKVVVLFDSFQSNILTLRIIDNGSGIPDWAVKKIFEANFSTKDDIEKSSIRGNGMFLNKQLIQSAGGNIKIINTSTNGTTIEISFLSVLTTND